MSRYVPSSAEEEQFLAAYDPSKYPITVVTVDMVAIKVDSTGPSVGVILVERAGYPYKGQLALPGGFINPDETGEEAATREFCEETGLKPLNVSFVGVFDQPDRDPRGRAISLAFMGGYYGEPVAGDDAAKVVEMPWADAMRADLAFDHHRILERAARFGQTGQRW